MSIVIITDKVMPEDIRKAGEEYGEYIKIVLDIETGLVAMGGEWHADGEKILLEKGSKQGNLWGGGIDIKTKKIETIAIINVRPNDNNESQEILDPEIRKKYMTIVKDKFNL